MYAEYEIVKYEVTWRENGSRLIRRQILHNEDKVIKFCRELSGQRIVIPESIKCHQYRQMMIFNEHDERVI